MWYTLNRFEIHNLHLATYTPLATICSITTKFCIQRFCMCLETRYTYMNPVMPFIPAYCSIHASHMVMGYYVAYTDRDEGLMSINKSAQSIQSIFVFSLNDGSGTVIYLSFLCANFWGCMRAQPHQWGFRCTSCLEGIIEKSDYWQLCSMMMHIKLAHMRVVSWPKFW
jgi:hypothetical protein